MIAPRTVHRNHQQDQAVLGNVARDEVVHQEDIFRVIAVGYESRQVDDRQVRQVRSRDLEHDDVP